METPEDDWRRESRIAEMGLRATGVFGGACVGAVACALTDSSRSRLLLIALIVIGAGVGLWGALQVTVRLPTVAGGRGLNALAPSWQGAMFLTAAVSAGGTAWWMTSTAPPMIQSSWAKLWLGSAVGLLILLGLAALVFRVDFRWYGLFDVTQEKTAALALQTVIAVGVLAALPMPANLIVIYAWLQAKNEASVEDMDEHQLEVRRYAFFAFVIELFLLLALALLWLGRKKLGFV